MSDEHATRRRTRAPRRTVDRASGSVGKVVWAAPIAVVAGALMLGLTSFDTKGSAEMAAVQEGPFGERWFADTSPWNQKIPDDIALLPGSAGFIKAFAASHAPINVNREIWTPTVLYAGNEAPRCDIHFPDWRIEGVPQTHDFGPMIDFFAKRGDTDSSFCIYSDKDEAFYNLWAVTQQPAPGGMSVKAGAAALFPIKGSGWWDNAMGPWSGRSSGASYCGGLIRQSELASGEIDHALSLGWPAALIRADGLKDAIVFPATTTDGKGKDPATAVPMGARMQLDPTLSETALLSMGLSAADLPVARALQTYGAYVTDSSSVMAIYVESSPGLRSAPVASLSGGWPAMMAQHFRFVAPPAATLLDNRVSVRQPVAEPRVEPGSQAALQRQCIVPRG